MVSCAQCGVARPDVVKRMGPKPDGRWPAPVRGAGVVDPVLCDACCAQAPGRGWMAGRVETQVPARSVPALSREARTGQRR